MFQGFAKLRHLLSILFDFGRRHAKNCRRTPPGYRRLGINSDVINFYNSRIFYTLARGRVLVTINSFKYILIPVFLLQVIQATNIQTVMDNQMMSAVASFSYKFLNELDHNKSVVSSPLSAEIVLALVALGSTDAGHDELLNALGLPNDESIRQSFSALSAGLKSVKGVTLNVANKVYINEGNYDLLPQLKEDAVKVFNAEIDKIKFGDSANAANAINTWVENKTNNRIKDLFGSDDFDNLTRLVLVNALYFKGSWKTKFNPRNTKDQPFHVDSKTQIDVPMMFKSADFNYGFSQELDSQLLEMKYEGNEASMLIVLPNQVEGLSAVMQKLAGGYELIKDIQSMRSTKVDVTLPKFKIETEIELKGLLQKLGIKKIFDRADSGLTRILNTDEKLFVSKAIQKAFIEVNEEGAEAAAATGVRLEMFSLGMSFVADHPFLLVLQSKTIPMFYAIYWPRNSGEVQLPEKRQNRQKCEML